MRSKLLTVQSKSQLPFFLPVCKPKAQLYLNKLAAGMIGPDLTRSEFDSGQHFRTSMVNSTQLAGGQHATSAYEELSQGEREEFRRKGAKAALDLKTQGWAHVEGVLPREVCEEYKNGFWDWLEGLGSGVNRNDPSTWKKPHWPESYRGIINAFEVSHQAFVWKIRKHPRIRQVFEELWGTNALLSSFDSINALPPKSQIDKQAWLHVDQAPLRQGHACIQGLVNLVDVSPATTGSLLVKTGTHNEHEHFFTSESKVPMEELRKIGDHYKFAKDEVSYWEQFESVGVAGKAGSLFLWDSRTVHANCFPDHTKEFRHVVYTCYQPAKMATKADLDKKKDIYAKYLVTTHWPAMNVTTHGNGEDYFGAGEDLLPMNVEQCRTRDSVEDEVLLKLAGVHAYTTQETRTSTPMLDLPLSQLQEICA